MNILRYGYVVALIWMVCVGARCIGDEVADDSDFKRELVVRSEWWPMRVKLTQPLDAQLRGKPVTLPVGRGAVLVRVNDSGVLVDLGSYGVRELGWEDTNTLALAHELSSKNTWAKSGDFLILNFNKFFWPEDLSQATLRSIDGKDYMLISYLKIGSDECQAASNALANVYSKLDDTFPNVGFWTIPMEQSKTEILDELKNSPVVWPIMFAHLAPGYVNAWHHDPDVPTAVLIDKNGKLLMSLKGESLSDPTAITENILQALDADESARKRFSM